MSTQTLSGSRAGAGSAVVADDAVARTVVVAGVGGVGTGFTAPAVVNGPIVTMIG